MKRNPRAKKSERLREQVIAWTAWVLFLSLVAGLVACAIIFTGARVG